MDNWEWWLRKVSITLIGGLVLAGSIGLLGVRTEVVTAVGGGYQLSVRYASVSRPGLATPLSIEVRSDDALPEEVTILATSSYLALFDDNGMEPLPVESYNTADWTSWTFAVPPDSHLLRVDLDARLEPAVQWGSDATVAVEVWQQRMASVDFTTKVAP